MLSTRSILNFFWIVCVAVAAGAQDGRTSFIVQGRVFQPNGDAAVRTMVKITGQSGLNQQGFTDDMGRFQFSNLPGGRYHLTAVNPTAKDQFTEPVELDLSRGMSNRVSVSIFLRNNVATTSSMKEKPGMVSVAEAAQNVPKPARKAYEQALKLRGDKQYEESLKSFGRSIELFPGYFQALAERGHLLIAMGRPSDAAEDFAHALELNIRYGPALRGSGICKFQQGKYVEAVEDLERAAVAEPGNAMIYLFMGTSYVALDRREQARTALLKALSIDASGAARAHVHLANLCIKENRLQEALSEIDSYLRVVPDAPDADKLRAVAAQLRANVNKNDE
jgi:tetratricopeptide (TPR) repeat protein